MNLKNKMIVLLLITFAILLIVPSMVNAATTVEYTRTIPSNDGTIKLNFTGLNLEVTKAYEFALVRQGGTPESWFSIDDGYTQSSATVTLSSATGAITNVLKATDTGFIYIREKDNITGSYVLEAYQVNLKLPYLQSLTYHIDDGEKYELYYQLYDAIGDKYASTATTNTYIKWEKITDKNLIQKFLNIKNSNGDIITLESDLPTYTTIGYTKQKHVDFTGKNDGLYLLWVLRTGENCKDVYSCIVHDGLPEATEVGQYIHIESENVTISKTSATIKVDETLQLTATSSKGSEITWTTSDSTIATVSSKGLVKGLKEGTAVITAKGNEMSATCTVTVEPKTTTGTEDNEDGEWTDFSKAKFELKKNGTSGAILEITGITPKNESNYYLFITSNSSKPNVTSDDKNKIYLNYNEKSKKFDYIDLAKYIELNQDVYITILEDQSYKNEKIVLSGKKIERFAEPKYSDAFFATFMTNNADQIVTTFTHDSNNDRKIQIKIGKITDISILQKIKNQDTSGFASLLTFAKSNKGMYDKLVDANKNYYTIAYDAGEGEQTGNSVIDLEGLQNEEYYFLYIKTDDENGKYTSQEAVTLAQASTYENGDWFLFFYGHEDFEWADFEDVEPDDDTKAPVDLPDTGIGKYIAIISILAIVVIASYIQVRKLKEIK